jgi:hypothetical protein
MDSPLTRAELARLHIWPRELGLDEDLRRDVQREVTGRESCRDMTYRDYLRLARHYSELRRRLGVQESRIHRASPSLRALYAKIERRGDRPGLATVAQLKKIVRMLSLPKGGEEKFLNRALRAYVGVVRWQWLDRRHAYDMIEALKARRKAG